jgi:hypothetical protein
MAPSGDVVVAGPNDLVACRGPNTVAPQGLGESFGGGIHGGSRVGRVLD